MPTSDVPPSYFFVHVMKVGGFSLARMIRTEIFSTDEIYPHAIDGNALEASMEYARLRGISEERRRRVRFYSGHFPFVAAATLGPHVKTFALLRDPVDRVISHLKHFSQRIPRYQGKSVAEVYDDAPFFKAFFDNLQLRAFALRDIEHGTSMFHETALTEDDIEYALGNVERLNALGLTEDFSDSVRLIAGQFGWTFRRPLHINRGEPVEIPTSLRDRIFEDQALDRQFYERAREIYRRRKREALERQPLPDFTDPSRTTPG